MLEGRKTRDSRVGEWTLSVAGGSESFVPPKTKSKFKADTQVEWVSLCDLMGSLRFWLPKNISSTRLARTTSLLLRPAIPTTGLLKDVDGKGWSVCPRRSL